MDWSTAGVRLLTQPIRIVFRGGVATCIEGGLEARRLEELPSRYGDEAQNLGEFGIGTNPGVL